MTALSPCRQIARVFSLAAALSLLLPGVATAQEVPPPATDPTAAEKPLLKSIRW